MNTSSYHRGFEHVPAALLPSDPSMYWQLTEEEANLVSLLTEAYERTQSGPIYVELSRPNDILCDQMMTIVRQMASDMVTFFSIVPDFCAIHGKDRAAALNSKAMALVLLRNAFATSLNSNGMDDVGPEVTPDRVTTQNEELNHRLSQFQRSLRPMLRNDLATAVILQCAVVFDSCVPELRDRQRINRLQDKYLILLKHYVESQCSYLFSWQYIEALFDLLEQCKDLAEAVEQQFHDWKAIIDPLILQIQNSDLTDNS